jgi:protein O-GlcNAc transferase
LPDNPLPREARTEYGLPDDAFVFACFNRLFKLDSATFAAWLRILHRVPHSVLWLLRVRF